jgi:hypothetical protein
MWFTIVLSSSINGTVLLTGPAADPAKIKVDDYLVYQGPTAQRERRLPLAM